ncbi:hypothetical protein CC2G_011883 [Coprinopsis cinerea AmutBmut pab1-1]|nr:hypothetical protein CC2G_011883 [Coprinopsis cinerea AmutBmut pab1-1]
MITLYDIKNTQRPLMTISPFCWRARLCLNYKGIPPSETRLSAHRPVSSLILSTVFKSHRFAPSAGLTKTTTISTPIPAHAQPPQPSVSNEESQPAQQPVIDSDELYQRALPGTPSTGPLVHRPFTADENERASWISAAEAQVALATTLNVATGTAAIQN